MLKESQIKTREFALRTRKHITESQIRMQTFLAELHRSPTRAAHYLAPLGIWRLQLWKVLPNIADLVPSPRVEKIRSISQEVRLVNAA
jgi:hypothetical protein